MHSQTIPRHLAFIMDGNRRWAKAHKLATLMGHNRGAERIETIVEAAAKKGIEYTTFWAFSTENWNREQQEVDTLITVFRSVLSGPIVGRMIKNGVKLQVIGEYRAFPTDIVKRVEELKELSKDNSRITATIALNYGGRAEILAAVNKILNEASSSVFPAKAGIQVNKEFLTTGSPIMSGMTKIVNEEMFSSYLYTKDQLDPDMIIRTGGEQRLSGFLPWQSVYSELYFTETFWPDFDEKEFEKALEEYGRRQRRFGK